MNAELAPGHFSSGLQLVASRWPAAVNWPFYEPPHIQTPFSVVETLAPRLLLLCTTADYVIAKLDGVH